MIKPTAADSALPTQKQLMTKKRSKHHRFKRSFWIYFDCFSLLFNASKADPFVRQIIESLILFQFYHF